MNRTELLYTEDVAALIGMTIESFKVARAVGNAPMPYGKVGSRLLFQRGDVDAWLAEREAGRTKVACGIVGCAHPGRARTGYCAEHGKRIAVRGSTDAVSLVPSRPRTLSPAQRFASYIEAAPDGGCLVWCGSDTGNSGYGKVSFNGRTERAHRVAFFLEHGRMPVGFDELDHECSNRACVRIGPGHVVEVPRQENMRRMFSRLRARKAAEQANVLPFRTPATPAEKVTPMPCAA